MLLRPAGAVVHGRRPRPPHRPGQGLAPVPPPAAPGGPALPLPRTAHPLRPPPRRRQGPAAGGSGADHGPDPRLGRGGPQELRPVLLHRPRCALGPHRTAECRPGPGGHPPPGAAGAGPAGEPGAALACPLPAPRRQEPDRGAAPLLADHALPAVRRTVGERPGLAPGPAGGQPHRRQVLQHPVPGRALPGTPAGRGRPPGAEVRTALLSPRRVAAPELDRQRPGLGPEPRAGPGPAGLAEHGAGRPAVPALDGDRPHPGPGRSGPHSAAGGANQGGRLSAGPEPAEPRRRRGAGLPGGHHPLLPLLLGDPGAAPPPHRPAQPGVGPAEGRRPGGGPGPPL